MNNPNPKSMLVAYSLINNLAYDFDFIYNNLFEVNKLVNSYILPYHINQQFYDKKEYNEKYEKKSLFKLFSKKGNWDQLICPNIYALSFFNNKFVEDLKNSNNPNNSFYQLGKVKILWTNIKNLEIKKEINLYKPTLNKEENPLNLIEGKYIEVEITLKDLALLNFGILKNETYNLTAYKIEQILKNSIFQGLTEEDKKILYNIGLENKSYIKEVLKLVDDRDLFPYIYNAFENGYSIELNAKSLPLFLMENLHEESSLYAISNNLSNNTLILSNLFKNSPKLIKETFPLIWKSFTNTKIKNGQDHNFLNNPERIINILHKLGFNREDISVLDQRLDYFLSNYMLEHGNVNVINELSKINLFNNDWLENHLNINWEKFRENNPDNLIYFLDILMINYNKNVFDIISDTNDQKIILDFIIEKGADSYISLAIQSVNFNNNILNEIIKIGKIKGTYLHKLAKEGKYKTVVTALMNGTDLNIPANNTLLQFLSSNKKYESLLEDVNNFILYDDLNKKISTKVPTSNIKKKI